MTKTNCTTTKRTFKHLTDIQRGRLEEMAKSGNHTQTEMTKELNVSQPTISRELKRGRTRQMTTNLTYYDRYLADVGALVYQENRQLCHAEDFHKYSEDFLEELPKAILSTKQKPREHSVDTFVQTYHRRLISASLITNASSSFFRRKLIGTNIAPIFAQAKHTSNILLLFLLRIAILSPFLKPLFKKAWAN